MNWLRRNWPYVLLLLGAAVAFSLAAYFVVGGIGFIVIIPFVFPIFAIGRGSRKPRSDGETQDER